MWPYTVPISHHIPAFLGFLSRSETIFYRLRLGDTPGYPWLLHKSTKTVQCHPFYSFGYESVWKWRCIWILTGRRDSIGMEGTFFPDQTILEKRLIFEAPSEKMTLLRAIPTLTLICHSFWHIIWVYIYIYGIIVWHSILAFYLTFYSGILSDILFWQSIWHLFWHPIWHPVWHLYWHFLWHSIWHFVPYVLAYVMACYLAFYLTFYSGILSSIYSDILSGVQSGISSEILCGWGPVGDTLIQSSRCRSGGEDLDPELAVDVRPESLWSRGCCSGPAGHTAIKSLQLRSGGGRRRRKAGQLT